MKNKSYIGWIMLIILIITPVGNWLESTMTTHVLVLYPLLVASGAMIAWPLRRKKSMNLRCINQGGIFGVLIATFTLAFWMIPKWVDYSLSNPWIGLSKFLTLAILVGYMLVISWEYLHPILKALLKIEFLTMLLRLGWIYLISPERLCNNYLINDQVSLGKGLLLLAAVLAFYWIMPLFIERNRTVGYN